jgi:hypothetical protein
VLRSALLVLLLCVCMHVPCFRVLFFLVLVVPVTVPLVAFLLVRSLVPLTPVHTRTHITHHTYTPPTKHNKQTYSQTNMHTHTHTHTHTCLCHIGSCGRAGRERGTVPERLPELQPLSGHSLAEDRTTQVHDRHPRPDRIPERCRGCSH